MESNDNPTAWEEINPATALAPRPEQPCAPSRTYSDLTPATPDELVTELAACLTLCAPAGLTEDGRTEWFKVARRTVGHLPLDMLRSGCAHARQIADHPSKIVPAIIAHTDDWLNRRRELAKEPDQPCLPAPNQRDVMDRRGEAMSASDTAELNDRLERLGATARYREDGSKYFIERAA